MNRFLKNSKNTKGASSVLVILMMVVLTLFGLSALTASLASFKLTEKAGTWTDEFYELESQAEYKLVEIDNVLNEAELKAVLYMTEKKFLLESGTILDNDIQKLIYMNMTEYLPKGAHASYLEGVMEAVYIGYVIRDLGLNFPESEISFTSSIIRQIIEDEVTSDVVFSFTVSEAEKEASKNIGVVIEVLYPGYSLDVLGNDVSGGRHTGGLRYDVLEWREWQEPFEYSENIQYAEPIKDN